MSKFERRVAKLSEQLNSMSIDDARRIIADVEEEARALRMVCYLWELDHNENLRRLHEGLPPLPFAVGQPVGQPLSHAVDEDKGVEEPCPHCGSPATAYHVTSGDWSRYDCPTHGIFEVRQQCR